MVQVTKIGYVGFNTPQMDAMLAYYTEVIGFTLEERGADGSAYLSNALDHHAIALYPSTENGVRHVGFQIHSSESLQEASAHLRDQGIQVETQTDAQPGVPAQLQLHDPAGNTLHLYAAMQPAKQPFHGSGIVKEGNVNLRRRNLAVRGGRPRPAAANLTLLIIAPGPKHQILCHRRAGMQAKKKARFGRALVKRRLC